MRVLIMGAAGRDFHNFNTYYRNHAEDEVVAFTATQIPNIEGRLYPAELAGPRYPSGIPIYAEENLADLIREQRIDEVVFSYSDVSHEHVMHAASIALAAGADFRLLGPRHTMLRSTRPVVAVTAVRTGVGKSQTTRRVCEVLKGLGLRVAVIRHPMPYGDLRAQICQRFATYQDLLDQKCTIEEREEYAPHIRRGNLVFAGIDYEKILRAAEAEADVVVWDGGNNDYPFYVPDYQFVLVDPLRAGHELTWHPGETNLRMAHCAIINKVDTARPEDVALVRRNIEAANPSAVIIEATSPVKVADPERIAGKKVLVIEDGPTVTHGGMSFGAGLLASRQHDAAEIVDPRPFAVGSLVEVFAKYPHLEHVLPAMGYSDAQMAELKATIEASSADVVVVGTPIDLGGLLALSKPHVAVEYDLQEVKGPALAELLAPVVAKEKISV